MFFRELWRQYVVNDEICDDYFWMASTNHFCTTVFHYLLIANTYRFIGLTLNLSHGTLESQKLNITEPFKLFVHQGHLTHIPVH